MHSMDRTQRQTFPFQTSVSTNSQREKESEEGKGVEGRTREGAQLTDIMLLKSAFLNKFITKVQATNNLYSGALKLNRFIA